MHLASAGLLSWQKGLLGMSVYSGMFTGGLARRQRFKKKDGRNVP